MTEYHREYFRTLTEAKRAAENFNRNAPQRGMIAEASLDSFCLPFMRIKKGS